MDQLKGSSFAFYVFENLNFQINGRARRQIKEDETSKDENELEVALVVLRPAGRKKMKKKREDDEEEEEGDPISYFIDNYLLTNLCIRR